LAPRSLLPYFLTGEHSGLLMRIAATESVSLRERRES
jgi:hypothetical protein